VTQAREPRVLRVEEACRGRRFSLGRVEALIRGRRVVLDALLHPGAVAVLAVDKGRVLLERQFRPVVGRWLYEIPAGTLEPGEEPEEAAARELREETGYVAGRLRRLLEFYPSPGVSTEKIVVFLAEELRLGERSLEPDEVIETVWLPLREALEMIRRAEIIDGKTIVALLYYAMLAGETGE